MALSSNAVRHRAAGGHSPSLDSSHLPSTSLDVAVDPNGNGIGGGGKLHAGKGRRRRDKKQLLVLGGAAFLLVLCLAGMWGSSASVDEGRGPRQIDQSRGHKKGRKKRPDGSDRADEVRRKPEGKKRPRGIGRRKEEDYFPIPENPERPRDMRKKQGAGVIVDVTNGDELPRLTLQNRHSNKAEWEKKSSEKKNRKTESQGSEDGKKHLERARAKREETVSEKVAEKSPEANSGKAVSGSDEGKEHALQSNEEKKSPVSDEDEPVAKPSGEKKELRGKEDLHASGDAKMQEASGSEDRRTLFKEMKRKSPLSDAGEPGAMLLEEKPGKAPRSSGGGKKHFIKSKKDEGTGRANDSKSAQASIEGSEETETAPVPKPLGKAGASSGDESRPRVLRVHFEQIATEKQNSDDKDTRDDEELDHKDVLMTKVTRLQTYESETLPSSDRFITPYPDDDEYFNRVDRIKYSKKYGRQLREPLEDKECKPQHEWQQGAFPNCNVLHEYELGQLSGMFGRAVRKKLHKREGDGDELVKYLAHGYWRDVWLVSKASRSFETPYETSSEFEEEITVLKTLRYRHDFTDRNYDRHRKDALASERLSRSPYVVDIFAYCSNSAVFEYGAGGDIDGKLWPYDEEAKKYYVADIPSLEKIDMAYQVASGIADMHDVEDDGRASIAHTDITPSQFIHINGKWKMNDFNRCRFMRLYKGDDSACGFYVGANPGKFRAPEEYNYEEENEMIDIYSMGNIFYTLIAGEMPFEGQKESKAQKKVMDGERPKIPEEVLESDDPAIQALVSATKKCWEQKPEDRPSAASIRDELKKVMGRIEVQSASKDGALPKEDAEEDSEEEVAKEESAATKEESSVE
ncbi:hypothetical protein ACHAXT_001169 [Thalassiosira profunda]